MTTDRTKIDFDIYLQSPNAQAVTAQIKAQLDSLTKQATLLNAALNFENGAHAGIARKTMAAGPSITAFLNAEAQGWKNAQRGLQQSSVNAIKELSSAKISQDIATATKGKLAQIETALQQRLVGMQYNAQFNAPRSETGKPRVSASYLAEMNEYQSLLKQVEARSTELALEQQRARKAVTAAEREHNQEIRTGIRLRSEARMAEQTDNQLVVQRARISAAKADVERQRELAAQGRKNTLESSEADLVRETKRLETLQAFQKVRTSLDKEETRAAKNEAKNAADIEKNYNRAKVAADSQLRIQQQVGSAYEQANSKLKGLNAELQRQRTLQMAGKPNSLSEIEKSYASQLKIVRELRHEEQLANAARNRREGLNRDGGAGLFAFQLDLMKNYLLMNQFFNLISFGTRFVVELDEAFRQLQAISGTTATSMERLKTSLMETSMLTKFTAVEVAQASVIMAQAGFSTDQIEKSIGAITLFATAVGEDLTKSVDLVTSTMSIFNLRTEEMGFVADFMVGALNRSKLTVDKLTYGLQYAGNTAQEAGIGFTELTTVLAAFANAGIRSGSTLGTGLRQLIVDLIDPSEKMVASLRSVGLTLEDVDVRSRGLIAVLKSMREAGFSTSHAFASMEVRSAAAYAAISRQAGGLHELERSMLLSQAAAEANAVQIQSLSNTIDRVVGVGGLFINELTLPLQKAFGALVNGAIELFSWLNKLGGVVKLFGTALLSLGVASVAVSIGRLIANFVFLNTTLVAAKNAARDATGALAAMGAAAKAMNWTTWIGLVVGAATALADMVGLFDNTTDKIDQARSTLESSQSAWDEYQSNMEAINEKISSLNAQYSELNGDSEALKTATTEISIRFRDMGLELPPVVSRVDDLTDALGNLKTRLNELNATRLTAVISDLQNVLMMQTQVSLGESMKLLGDVSKKGGLLDEFGNSAALGLGLPENIKNQIHGNVATAGLHEMSLSQLIRGGDFSEENVNLMEMAIANAAASYQKAIEAIQEEIRKNPDAANYLNDTLDSLRKQRDTLSLTVAADVQKMSMSQKTRVQDEFEKNSPLIKETETRSQEWGRKFSENILVSGMSAQQEIDALTEHKRQVESLQALREAELKAMRDAGQVKEALLLENSEAWKEQGNLLSKEIQETQKLIDGNTKTVEASRKDTEETLRSQMQRLTEERRTTKQGSAEWTDLGNRISEIIKKQAEFDLDNMDKEIAETKDSGRLATLTAKREERVKMLNADLDRVWDLREGGSGPSLAGAVSGAKNALADTIDSWRDALQSAKDDRDNKIAEAQDALKIFDEKIENAERTGKYSDFDIQYAKRETRKGTELASLQTEAAGRRDYANAIRAQGLETAKALNKSIAWYDQERKSAKTDGERIAATKEWAAARTQLMAVTREVSTAEREATSIAGRLAAAMGQSTISTIELSDAIRTSIKWYLEDNDGNLGMVDYFKTNLPNAVGSAGGALSKFFRDTASGTVSVADGFRAMAGSIIESLLDIAAQYAAMAIF